VGNEEFPQQQINLGWYRQKEVKVLRGKKAWSDESLLAGAIDAQQGF
jgi:hypothetical protein